MTAQNFVTLPREVVEKAWRALDCAAELLDEQSSAASARNELRAALTEQVQPSIRDAFGLDDLARYNANQAEVYRKVVLAIRNALPEGHEVDLNGLVQLVTALAQTEQVQPAVNTTGAHTTHCYQGEYAHSCKYGNEHCPMQHEQPAQGELETLRAALIQWHQNMMEVCRDSDGTAYLNHRDTAALLQSNAECVPLSEERISACLARAKGKFGTLTPTDIARELEAEITKGQQ